MVLVDMVLVDMVLVDTSVWIRFLAGTEPYASELDRLLASDEVLGHDFVYGEH
jgi:predicted nucleic acid-binding protein